MIATAAAIVLTATISVQVAPGQPSQRPNVLFILSDDQRTDTIAALGNDQISTPALDGLVAHGTTFTNAYCMGSHSGAVCGPSRAMILTGRGLNRVGNPFAVSEDMETMPERFRAAGYQTFATGKWHSGKESFARGFTHGGSIFFGGMGSHTELQVHDFDPGGVYDNANRRSLSEFSSAEFVSRASEFLDTRDPTAPFFMYVSFTGPHDPRTPPAEFGAMYEPAELTLPPNFAPVHPFHNGEMTIRDEKLAAWPRTEAETREHLADYYGMISHMDTQIGRLMITLDAAGLAEDTIIVFASDHGLAIGSHGLMGKQNLYEHSTKAPLIVVDPRAPAGAANCDGLVYLHDIFPTAAELTGVGVAAELDGRSLAPCLAGGCEAGACAGRDALLTIYKDAQRAVRDERWKLIVYPPINRLQLFDLAADPHETNDLASDPAMRDQIDRLLGVMARLQADAGDAAPLRTDAPRSPWFDHVEAEASR